METHRANPSKPMSSQSTPKAHMLRQMQLLIKRSTRPLCPLHNTNERHSAEGTPALKGPSLRTRDWLEPALHDELPLPQQLPL